MFIKNRDFCDMFKSDGRIRVVLRVSVPVPEGESMKGIREFYTELCEEYKKHARALSKKAESTVTVALTVTPIECDGCIAFSRKTSVRQDGRVIREHRESDCFDISGTFLIKAPKSITKQRFIPSRKG